MAKARRVKQIVFWCLLLAPAAGLLALVAAELYLRATFARYSDDRAEQDAYLPDPEVGWIVKPMPGIANGEGFRNAGPVPPEPAGRRVLLLGDSILFAYYASRAPAGLSEQLAALAADKAEAVDFVNISAPGYCTYQERLLLQRHIARLNPDVVVVCYCLNDTLPTEDYFRNLDGLYAHWPPEFLATRLRRNPRAGHQDSLVVVRQIRNRMRHARERRLARTRSAAFFDGGARAGPAQELVVSDLRHMQATAEAHGAEFLLVLYPARAEIGTRQRYRDVAYIREHVSPQTVIVDLYPLFVQACDDGAAVYLSEDDIHPTSEMQRTVAAMLYPLLAGTETRRQAP